MKKLIYLAPLFYATSTWAARPGAFHSDLLLLYLGIGGLLGLLLGIDYGLKKWKGK